MRGLLLLVGLSLVACQGAKDAGKAAEGTKPKDAPAVAPSQKAQVNNTKGAAPGAAAASQPTKAAPGSQPTAKQMPPGHPPPASQPTGAASQPTGAASQPTSMPAAGGGGAITGTIELDPALIDSVKGNTTLYIVARRVGQRMPLAVKKLAVRDAKMFPLKYALTAADAMVKGVPFNGQVTVEARIDQDGDAISKQPGDVIGQAAGDHQVGGAAVNFTLNARL